MNIGKVRAFVGGGGVCEVCVLCFSEDPSGEFSPRGDRFPQKKKSPRGANSEDITVFVDKAWRGARNEMMRKARQRADFARGNTGTK